MGNRRHKLFIHMYSQSIQLKSSLTPSQQPKGDQVTQHNTADNTPHQQLETTLTTN